MAEELVGGRYRVEAELGRGASATVFSAYDVILERRVALKVISSALAADPEFAGRFEREGRLAAGLDHPHIVTVYDVGTMDDGRGFIAMRLLEGEGLDTIIARRAPLPPSEAGSINEQLASALDYMHARGLIHRDVKPSNVRIDPAGRATLTDFGIARVLESARVTLPGLVIGTPRYMSPEQVRGEDVTAASDIYSLAVMAYEMLAGRPPFDGEGTSLMFKIMQEEPPSPAIYNPRVPLAVLPVLQRGLAKGAAQRWPTAGQFATGFSTALSASAVTTVFPATDSATPVSAAALAPESQAHIQPPTLVRPAGQAATQAIPEGVPLSAPPPTSRVNMTLAPAGGAARGLTSFTLRMTNPGPEPATFSLAATEPTGTLHVTVPASVTIEPGHTEQAIVEVRQVRLATTKSQPVAFQISARGRSGSPAGVASASVIPVAKGIGTSTILLLGLGAAAIAGVAVIAFVMLSGGDPKEASPAATTGPASTSTPTPQAATAIPVKSIPALERWDYNFTVTSNTCQFGAKPGDTFSKPFRYQPVEAAAVLKEGASVRVISIADADAELGRFVFRLVDFEFGYPVEAVGGVRGGATLRTSFSEDGAISKASLVEQYAAANCIIAAGMGD